MSKKTMSVPDAMWASIDLNRAIRRVAEAALKILHNPHVTRSLWFATQSEEDEFIAARNDLRRLKGEG